MVVRDPLFYRWSYFPREHGQTWPAFRVRLRESLWWAGGNKAEKAETDKTHDKAPPRAAILGTSVRLAVHPFPQDPEEGKWCRQALAYGWLDTYFVRLGQLRRGNVHSDQAFSGLDEWSPASTPTRVVTPSDSNRSWGEATCLLAEVDDGLDVIQLCELAEQCYASFFGAVEGASGFATGGMCLPFGFLAVVATENRDDVVLLYYASKSRVLQVVPEFALHRWFLSNIKIRHCIARQRAISQAEGGKKHEKTISTYLREATGQGYSLRRLEALSSRLSRQMVDMGNRIGEMEKDLQVMQVASRNVMHLVNDASLWEGASRTQLASLLVEPIVVPAEQMEWDVKHVRLQYERAKSMQEHVATVADIRRARWERWIALLLFGTVVLEMFHAFHDDLPSSLYVRMSIAIIIYVVLFAVAWGLDYLLQFLLPPGGDLVDGAPQTPNEICRNAGSEPSEELS